MSVDSWETLTLFAEDSLVKTFPSQANAQDLLGNEPVCSGTHSLSQRTSKRNGSSWRMCQDWQRQIRDAISEQSSLHWMTQGIATLNGEFWTRSSLESRNVAVECSLLGVLEDTVDERYFLSQKACEGILRRASRRGKNLPLPLEEALKAVC
jgi:hypothetical protein